MAAGMAAMSRQAVEEQATAFFDPFVWAWSQTGQPHYTGHRFYSKEHCLAARMRRPDLHRQRKDLALALTIREWRRMMPCWRTGFCSAGRIGRSVAPFARHSGCARRDRRLCSTLETVNPLGIWRTGRAPFRSGGRGFLERHSAVPEQSARRPNLQARSLADIALAQRRIALELQKDRPRRAKAAAGLGRRGSNGNQDVLIQRTMTIAAGWPSLGAMRSSTWRLPGPSISSVPHHGVGTVF